MVTLVDAFDEMLEPQFTRFKQGRKRPTEQSIERLTEKYGSPGEEDHQTVTYYLVEVELGYLRDINARPATFPASQMTYLSEGGRLTRCLVKATPTDGGELEPKSGVKPAVVRPWMEGTKATDDQWQEYAPVLHHAHGLFLSSDGE